MLNTRTNQYVSTFHLIAGLAFRRVTKGSSVDISWTINHLKSSNEVFQTYVQVNFQELNSCHFKQAWIHPAIADFTV